MDKKIKILGISSSYTNGCTDYALQLALEEAGLVDARIETSMLRLREYKLEPCVNCNYCIRTEKGCCLKDDVEIVMEQIWEADAYLLASPVYSYNPTPSMLTLFNRMRCMRKRNLELFGRPGACLAVGGTRSGGQEWTINCMMNCLFARNILVVGGSSAHFNYTGGKLWNNNRGLDGAKEDEIGIESVKDIGNCLARAAVLIWDGRKEAYESNSAGN